jgi:hypothetical protein
LPAAESSTETASEQAAVESWDIHSLAIEPHHPPRAALGRRDPAIAIRLSSGEELQEHQVHERAYLLVASTARSRSPKTAAA